MTGCGSALQTALERSEVLGVKSMRGQQRRSTQQIRALLNSDYSKDISHSFRGKTSSQTCVHALSSLSHVLYQCSVQALFIEPETFLRWHTDHRPLLLLLLLLQISKVRPVGNSTLITVTCDAYCHLQKIFLTVEKGSYLLEMSYHWLLRSSCLLLRLPKWSSIDHVKGRSAV